MRGSDVRVASDRTSCSVGKVRPAPTGKGGQDKDNTMPKSDTALSSNSGLKTTITYSLAMSGLIGLLAKAQARQIASDALPANTDAKPSRKAAK